MITVAEALSIVENQTKPTNESEEILLTDAVNRVLAQDIHSPINMPPFPQSAMDGYAIYFQNTDIDYQVVGEVAAGVPNRFALNPNQAVRIFTGAEVPSSANMVVRQEDVVEAKNGIRIIHFPPPMANIRPKGEQIRKGDLAIKKGKKITIATVGFLASIGVQNVKIYRQPKISIIATGSELVLPGKELQPGEIYDSNSGMLKAALKNYGFSEVSILRLKDNFQATVNLLAECLKNYDLIICSGGISVGDYDFIGKALKENKVQTHFYKVKQKPGKPLYFGQKNQATVFGLPGNPAACLTGFYIYILPFLHKWSGGVFAGLLQKEAIIAHDYSRTGDRAEFLKASYQHGELTLLEGQSSAMLKSFAEANAIVYLPIDKTTIEAGETVTYFVI